MSKNLYVRKTQRFLLFLIIMAMFLFLPAGTFNYWEAWIFTAVYFACNLVLTLWFIAKDPNLVERRMNVGPAAEKEKSQKIIIAIIFLLFAGELVVPALDHRFGWSEMPVSIVITGNVLIAFSYLIFYFVFRENTYGAATIHVEKNQKVISSGPYKIVRHPMYSGVIIMMLGIPLALGSWWGLTIFIAGIPTLAWRIIDEERILKKDLPGYIEYTQKVNYRLIPLLW